MRQAHLRKCPAYPDAAFTASHAAANTATALAQLHEQGRPFQGRPEAGPEHLHWNPEDPPRLNSGVVSAVPCTREYAPMMEICPKILLRPLCRLPNWLWAGTGARRCTRGSAAVDIAAERWSNAWEWAAQIGRQGTWSRLTCRHETNSLYMQHKVPTHYRHY